SLSTDYWGVKEAVNIKPSQFTKSAVFASYGCNQGDAGGLAEKLRALGRGPWTRGRATTAVGRTGRLRGPTTPPTAHQYVEYPAPSVNDKGGLVKPLPPARPLKYSKTDPPS